MNSGPCPHCGIIRRQPRPDGRCNGCGNPLPARLAAPGEAAYRDSVTELIRRAESAGYDATALLSDPRIRQLVAELDKLGGEALVRLVHDQVQAIAGRAQADVLRYVWLDLTGPSSVLATCCDRCGRVLQGDVYLVQEGGRTKEVCRSCMSQGTGPPAGAGQPSKTPGRVTRFLGWLFGARRGPELEPRYGIPQSHGSHVGAAAVVASLMREVRELPIRSVREHAVAHVKVDRRGGIFLNGKRVSTEELKGECARLDRIGGVVFYYRENPAEPAPRAAEAVIATICEARLPVTFAGRDYDPEVKVAEYFQPEEAS